MTDAYRKDGKGWKAEAERLQGELDALKAKKERKPFKLKPWHLRAAVIALSLPLALLVIWLSDFPSVYMHVVTLWVAIIGTIGGIFSFVAAEVIAK